MTILDADVWIAFLNTDDSQHAKAQKLFRHLDAEGVAIIVPEYVVLEVVTVLRRTADAEVATLFMKTISENERVRLLPVDLSLFKTVCAVVYSGELPKLSFTDLALLTLSRTERVYTFDRALARAIAYRANLG